MKYFLSILIILFAIDCIMASNFIRMRRNLRKYKAKKNLLKQRRLTEYENELREKYGNMDSCINEQISNFDDPNADNVFNCCMNAFEASNNATCVEPVKESKFCIIDANYKCKNENEFKCPEGFMHVCGDVEYSGKHDGMNEEREVKDIEECKEKCKKDPQCQGFEFYHPTSKCNINYICPDTARDGKALDQNTCYYKEATFRDPNEKVPKKTDVCKIDSQWKCDTENKWNCPNGYQSVCADSQNKEGGRIPVSNREECEEICKQNH